MYRILSLLLLLPASAFAAADLPTVGGIPVDFILFALTLLGVALFRGVPVGPLIAAGIISLFIGKS